MRGTRWSSLVLLLALLAAAGIIANRWFTAGPRPDPTRGFIPSRIPGELGPIMGEVMDGDTPVAGARVRFKGDLQTVLTDVQGRFRLPPPPTPSSRVTAWKEGYLIAGARADSVPLRINLRRLPAEDCERYAWVDPTPDPAARQNCGNCHGEIYREWAQSGHARAATGRHFRNLYDGTDWDGRPGAGWSLLDQHPDGAGVCTACHAPTVPFDDPAYYDLRQVRGVAALGVHCDYCHKVADAGGGTIGLTHGRFGMKLLRPPLTPTPRPSERERGKTASLLAPEAGARSRGEGAQLFFGPLDDVDRGEDAYSPLYRDSRYCASCHEGTIFGVHVYGTYSEWLESPARRAGQHCQHCHMAPTGRLTNLAPGKGGIERDPGTLGNHLFFDVGLREMLRDCLQVVVELTTVAGGVRADVEVRAERVGHRVPTGFIDRHLLLVVQGVGPDGRLLPARDGPTLPEAAGRELSGQPGRLYAKLLKDFEGRSPAPFWKADPSFVDTRLHPGQPDRSAFTFPAGLDHVRVRLIYRRFWQEVAQVKRWPDNEIILLDRIVSVRQKRWSAALR